MPLGQASLLTAAAKQPLIFIFYSFIQSLECIAVSLTCANFTHMTIQHDDRMRYVVLLSGGNERFAM